MRRASERISGVVVVAAVLTILEIAATLRLISALYLPAPSACIDALHAMLVRDDLWPAVGATLARTLTGWGLATAIGVALGLLIGLSDRWRAFLSPLLEFMRPLPAAALIPLAILMLGLTDVMIAAAIAFGAVWPVLLNTVQGVRAVDPILRDVARVTDLGRSAFVTKIIVPATLPHILAGARIALAGSLILSVVGEMLASRTGLGSTILLAARSYRSADLYAGVALLSALGVLMGAVLNRIQGWSLRWRAA